MPSLPAVALSYYATNANSITDTNANNKTNPI
jgi:hypothetical protein